MAKIPLEQIAYEAIKHKILQIDIKPGEALYENELAAELSMSRTPIRSALARLAKDGLVVPLKKRGALVNRIGIQELFEMQGAIAAMQLYVLEEAGRKGIPFDLERLLLCLNRMKEATTEKNNRLYYESNLNFNRSIIGTTSNSVLLQLFDSLKDRLLVFLLHERVQSRSDRPYTGIALFEALYEALASGSADEAIRILKRVEWSREQGLIGF